MLQVTDKTRADIKGGTLIQYEGKVIFPKLNICSHMSIYISGKTGGKVYSIYEAKFSWQKYINNISAPSAGGGPGAQGARGRLQVGQKVQRLQHKQSLDKVNIEIFMCRHNDQSYLNLHPLPVQLSVSLHLNVLTPSLPAIQRLVEERALDMEIIVNPKVKFLHHCSYMAS